MSNSMLKSQSDDPDDQILLPVASLFPPNQIVTKKYSPDVKPAFKLIQPEKREKKKVTLTNEAPPDYWQLFAEWDTLGFEYSALLRTKIVYLKFNNGGYMKAPVKGRQHRYLAGMFIPLEKLLSDGLKKAKNVYKILPNLEYIDNKMSYEASFNYNCYSAAPQLRFSSNYESSNLFAAIQTGECSYDLILQNDTNSKGNTQWFNFTVEISEQRNYSFNIVNLTKSSSLYQKGMTVAYLSQAAKGNSRSGWSKGCHSISYKQSSVYRQDSEVYTYYCLHFEYRSPYKNDVVTFAYSFPYTQLDLERFFQRIMLKKMSSLLKIDKIKVAETLSGFPIFVYKIAVKKHVNKKSVMSTQSLAEGAQQRQGAPSVVFLARQHPGESQGSYVAEGIVEWLLEGELEGWKKAFEFYVVPMVNIDGVYYGNYRTNLSGNDLNRIWRQPRKDYHSEIYMLKKYFFALNKTHPISLIVDIHGHSNSLNSFFYGNPPRKEAENPRLFPYYCSRKVKQISFAQSTFVVSEDKKACARVVLSEMFPKALVYTFENSFYGWRRGKTIVQHTIESYRRLGRDLVQCFIEYNRLCEKNPVLKERWVKEIEELGKEMGEGQEEVVSESDGEADRELIEFAELTESVLADSFTKESSCRSVEKKLSTPSIGKNKFIKYMRRHSPLKLRSYANNETYFTEKAPESTPEPQGFLSIIKINTRSNIEGNHGSAQNLRKTSVKQRQGKRKKEDQVIEFEGEEMFKENEGYPKVSRLVNEKELVLEKQRQVRRRIEEGLMHSKTYNGFFKYNYLKKE